MPGRRGIERATATGRQRACAGKAADSTGQEILERRGRPSAGVPERQDVDRLGRLPVIDVVVDSVEQDPSHTPQSRRARRGANSRMRRNERVSLFQVFCDRTGGRGPVVRPPREASSIWAAARRVSRIGSGAIRHGCAVVGGAPLQEWSRLDPPRQWRPGVRLPAARKPRRSRHPRAPGWSR